MASRESSKTTIMLNDLAKKNDAKAKAILALFAIAESMKATGGDTDKNILLKSAAVMRANGNESAAKAIEEQANKLPASVRGVTLADAMKQAAPHLAAIGKTAEDVFKNGLTALGTKVSYGIGLENGVFEKPEPKAKPEAPKATTAEAPKK